MTSCLWSRGKARVPLALAAVLCLTVASVSAGAAAISVSAGQPAALTVAGTVRDAGGTRLEGAEVVLGPAATRSDASGAWRVVVAPGRYLLAVRLAGFDELRREIDVSAALGPVEVILTRPLHWTEDIVVRAVRAGEQDPVTKADLTRPLIERVNRGQEMPFVLGATPSVTFQSDSGIAAGYAYFTIRGIGQTRLNVTLDGIPLQDPEDQALYFSNFGDFVSVVDSVQVQRGVGTSSVGAASYGGSVNFASVNPSDRPALELQAGTGSWGSHRGTAALHSGRLRGGLALYGRFSAQTSDGFREHSGADQRTVYFGATRQDARSLLKVFGFSGRTRTQLAFLATDEATLRENLRANPLTPDERDRFGQDVVQAQYTRLVGASASTTLMAQAYYNGAQGWFRIWEADRANLQQFGLDGHVVGLVLGATHAQGRLSVNWGAHVNDFTRDHFMDIVGGERAYRNTGLKNEITTFAKATWTAGRAQFWGDAQVRHARFEYRGDLDLGEIDWTFFNPKAGVRVEPMSWLGIYASLGRMVREPARSDMLAGEDNATLPYDLSAVRPERVVDFEAGAEVRRGPLTIAANVYAMEFRDEIALTGELSEIGLPVRRNVGESARRGVELDATWAVSPQLRLGASGTFSRNRIAAWTQYYDVYDGAGAWVDTLPIVHRNVPPLLTPGAIANGTISWLPVRDVGLDAAARWVGASHLDNTGNRAFRTPSFFTLDGQVTLSLSRLVKRGEPRVRLQGVNLLNEVHAWPGGYSYRYFHRDAQGRDTPAGTAYYYPLATRSAYLTVDVRF